MNENIPQLSTIKIRSNHEIGTAVIYYPSPDVDDVYVLTAKHCLEGKKFDKEYVHTDIKLEEIFNQETSDFHSYNLTETDIIVVSNDEEDMALLILSKKNILPLTGKQFFCQVIDTDELVEDYQIRGYANFNDQEADRPFPMKFIEDIKSNRSKFTLKSENSLDTYYQQALENVEGLSGSGAYSILNGKTYFTGIIHTYEDGGVFLATKVLAYNKLIPYPRFSLINSIRPETDKDVLLSFEEMEKNEQTINSRTREKVGDFNVPRDNKALLQLLKEKNLVVVHGNPGVGKSALTKSAAADLKMSGDHTVLTFTAENLYCETLSEALIKARCKVSIEQILSSPLSNKYFLIWIESFEKLIESGSSGAFNELLQILKKNKNITIVITIRDYLLQKFKIDYYYELPGNMAYFQVDEFNDDEVELIVEKIPDLLPLMENSKIRHLLRTPYYLDKAVRIIPELLSEEHLDELQFKRLMWKHIVEDNQSRRGTVFYEICLKRSREMSLFTSYEGDDEITANLVRDNILQLDSMADENSFSPSHDILEDWALIRFIRHQKSTIPDPKDFLLSIESIPSMRRALRLWMEEFYIYDPEGSVYFVHQLLGDTTLSDSWKDELLVVSLRSGHSKILLDSFKGKLLLDEGKMLKRVMFLLQTGCKKIDPVKRDFNYLLPLGSGWDYIINFIKENILEIQKFANFEILYLNLIESWSKQLPAFNQSNLPAGAESAAHLLEDYIFRYQTNNSSRRSSKSVSGDLKLYFEILFKLTEAAPELVANIINASTNPITGNERWTNTAMLLKVRNYITDGVFSDQICRFFPDEVLKVAAEDWAKKQRNRSSGSLSDMIIRHPEFNDFGLEKDLDYHYGFPSGYQTFFYWMFLHNPEKAVDFIIPFLNTAFEVNQKIRTSLAHEIENIEITFTDGSSNTYYGSNEYWSMYRGFSGSDKIVVSLLMALEKALLDAAEKKYFKNVKDYLSILIRETNNVAVLGLVSSILQAYPDLVDETSVSLLGIPLFFIWDSSRYTTDMVSKSVYNNDKFEKEERIIANNRIHRNKYYLGLTGFVADYMFHQRDMNALLFKQVDDMWKNVDEKDVYFKKFLFDMDARKYDFKPFEQQGYENYVQVVPGYDQQVQQMVDSGKDLNYSKVNANWARAALDNEILPSHNYETWKIGYEYILALNGKPDFMVAPATMAALALRDFSEQLQPEEVTWCCEILIKFAESKLVEKDFFAAAFDILESTSAIKGLIYILKNNISPDIEIEVKKLIFVLVLKGLEERERIVFLAGILHELSIHQSEFVLNCWYGLAEAIKIIKEQNEEEERRKELYHQGEISYDEYNVSIEDKWSEPLTISVINGTVIRPETISVSLDLATFWHLDDLLRLTPWEASLPIQQQFVQDLLKQHLNFLIDHRADKLNFFESRHAFTFFYPRYLLNQSTTFSLPLFNELLDFLIGEEGYNQKKITRGFLKFIYEIVEEFIKAVNGGMQVENFWNLWGFLKEWSIKNSRALFLPLYLFDTKWYEISEKKIYLEEKSLCYKDFITTLGFNTCNSAIRFIGNVSFYNFMPDSISWITPLLTSQNVGDVDIMLLENFVEKSFYKYGSKIKRNQKVLADFLFILDFLVKNSSSKSYMLREELLQYK